MKKTILRILDQVNCKFTDLDPLVRRDIVDRLKFMIPYARHTPAFRLGRWDGKVSYATIGGGTYINLLDRVLPLVIEAGYEIELEDLRPQYDFKFPQISESMLAHKTWPEGHPKAGEPIMLRDYQVAAIKRYTENLQSIQSISTGAGKTILSATLSSICEPFGRTLVIVPSKSLVEQTEEDFKNLGLDTGVFFGDRKEWGHQHTIATWQSLSIFQKKSKAQDDIIPISEFLKDVICVQVDEAHTGKANELRELLAGPLAHIPIRWGMTGTVPKEDFEFLTLLSTIGPVVGEVRAADLQERGVLADCDIKILQTVDDHVEFPQFDEEYNYLCTDKKRVAWIASLVEKASESGNTLVLVDRRATGEMLMELLPNAVFINGDVKLKQRKKEYKEVQTAEGKIIIATYGVAAVGINVPRIFNLFLLDVGKAFTRVIQSVGRALRTANDKDSADIYDICSTLKFSKRHLTKRKSFYKEAEYKHSVTKVEYR